MVSLNIRFITNQNWAFTFWPKRFYNYDLTCKSDGREVRSVHKDYKQGKYNLCLQWRWLLLHKADFLCRILRTINSTFPRNGVSSLHRPRETLVLLFALHSNRRSDHKRLPNWTIHEKESSWWNAVQWFPWKNTSPLSAGILLNADHSGRGLTHELSSLARKLGSWVRIPLKAWMSVCFYSVFVLFCV
jgi:hypothetical protein